MIGPDSVAGVPREAPVAASDDGFGVLSYLLTGVFLFGGAGWALDALLGTAFLLPVGLVAGAALAVYTVFLRYGREPAIPELPAHLKKGRR